MTQQLLEIRASASHIWSSLAPVSYGLPVVYVTEYDRAHWVYRCRLLGCFRFLPGLMITSQLQLVNSLDASQIFLSSNLMS